MKLICVPKNTEAMIKLDYNEAKSSDLCEIQLSKEEFESLWNIGYFKYINSKAGTMITDYEEDQIGDLGVLESLLRGLNQGQYNNNPLAQKITHCFSKAIEYKTGVYFFSRKQQKR